MDSVPYQELGSMLRGPVLTPEDDAYHEAASVNNGMIQCSPGAVARPLDEADVMAAIRFAGERGLTLAVRGGGHSVPGFGTCDEGLVLDLSLIRNVRVDPERRTARVGGGALLGDLDHATHAFGLATPAGFISTTGVAGLTLGGGVSGYLGRKHGLTCDNLLSADVITSAGRRVTASEDENPDLFWALRGGGGNFGVVTSFEFRLHPVSEVVGGPIFFEFEAARELLPFYQEYLAAAPRELGGFPGFHLAPPLPFIPEEHHGKPFVVIVVCWSGALEDADEVLSPIRHAGPVVAEHVGRMPYPALQSAFDALVPAGLQNYWKADYLGDLTDDALDVHMEYARELPSVHSVVHFYPMDGAVQDVDQDATAFSARDARFALNIAGIWEDPAENGRNVDWVKRYYNAAHPHSGFEGGYTNFMAADDQERARTNYGKAYERLARIKAEYDPDNLFRLNQNIRPGG